MINISEDRLRWLVREQKHLTLDGASEIAKAAPDLLTEIERLRAALKPFANIDARVTFQDTVPGVVIKTDDVKRAREALTPQQSEGKSDG